MLTAAEIRSKYLDFFKSKGHSIVPSAPIVIKNDPTLLFTNAGMNQFKDFFLGNSQAPHQRIADTQKCLRVSGKHNDLEEVGVDTYHHTMFEMLGNWSFGDYFKKEAIAWSWELLTEVYGIAKENLYVTIFEGNEKDGIPKDIESLEEWKKYVSDDHILLGNKKDNFWEMGDVGPCGPCTEIHADCRPQSEKTKIPGSTLVNKDHPQVIEIWNNVFIQYNRKMDGNLDTLPQKNVDTGMGFERLVRVLQNKTSNYDTDIFSETIEGISKIVNKKYTSSDSKQDVAFRVLADHIRAIGFTIADGQLPSNTGAGYVIRRILRRAARYYYSYLDYKTPLLHQILPIIALQFKDIFPELNSQLEFVSKVIKEEEESFLRTLEKGLKRIDIIISNSTNKTISGSDAFELLDTYGFPIDLVKLIASENGFDIDENGFDAEMQEQKNRSRSATAIVNYDWNILQDEQNTDFIGYTETEAQTKILRYRKVNAKGKELFQIVIAKSPFYAESGGQVGDTGSLFLNDIEIKVTDTKKENNQIILFAETIPDNLSGNVKAAVDIDRRSQIATHHSATHLMHAALRKILGTHVEQKGSLVNEFNLRFDFSHFSKMTNEEILMVEKIVNEKIRANIPIVIKSMPKEDALKLGAMALFGEKYGDTVRVVIMDEKFSVELCGGTHVGSTGELGFFKIISETAVAAGVRRIEAICGLAAENYVTNSFEQYNLARAIFKNPKDLSKAIENLQSENSSLTKHIEHLEAIQLVEIRNKILQTDEIINNVNFIGQIVEVSNPDSLKKICSNLKNHLSDYVVVLGANIGGKANMVVAISDTVAKAKNINAGQIIKNTVSGLIKGGGGGNASLASAGGIEIDGLRASIEAIREILKTS